jgi:tetratricopeptide (TPR) repeat protein
LAINICTEIENWLEGLRYVNNAIDLEPQMEPLYMYKCKFYLQMGENIKAIRALEEGINKAPNSCGDLKKQLKKLRSLHPRLGLLRFSTE